MRVRVASKDEAGSDQRSSHTPLQAIFPSRSINKGPALGDDEETLRGKLRGKRGGEAEEKTGGEAESQGVMTGREDQGKLIQRSVFFHT